jgi:hypothetical protein
MRCAKGNIAADLLDPGQRSCTNALQQRLNKRFKQDSAAIRVNQMHVWASIRYRPADSKNVSEKKNARTQITFGPSGRFAY